MTLSLQRLGLWLAKQAGYNPVHEPSLAGASLDTLFSSEVMDKCLELIRHVEKFPTSGEHKRNQVLRAMMNFYPNMPHRDISLAIELALRKL